MAGGCHVPQLLTGLMTRIVTTSYRYKRPARKRKASRWSCRRSCGQKDRRLGYPVP